MIDEAWTPTPGAAREPDVTGLALTTVTHVGIRRGRRRDSVNHARSGAPTSRAEGVIYLPGIPRTLAGGQSALPLEHLLSGRDAAVDPNAVGHPDPFQAHRAAGRPRRGMR